MYLTSENFGNHFTRQFKIDEIGIRLPSHIKSDIERNIKAFKAENQWIDFIHLRLINKWDQIQGEMTLAYMNTETRITAKSSEYAVILKELFAQFNQEFGKAYKMIESEELAA